MTIFRIDPLEDDRWKTFIEIRSDASIFHRGEWLRALKVCYAYEPIAFTTSPPGAPLSNGLLFCGIRSNLTGRRLVSLPFSDTCEPLVQDAGELSLFLEHMVHLAHNRWKYVEIRPVSHIPRSCSSFAISSTYYLHHLDLSRSAEALFKSFHKSSIQRKILRAQRELLAYEAGCSESMLQEFYKLLIMTRRRQNLPPQPLKWFRSLIASIGQDLTIRVARKCTTPVASILTISNKKTMVYKYGCSDSRYNNYGGMAMLFWNAIQEAKAAGIEELDFGRSEVENCGLVTYKDHWGTRRSTMNYWRHPAQAAGSMRGSALNNVKGLISIAPDASLVMLGRFLYRHVG